jgi:cytochrome c-type biogenesis protein CcmF
MAVGETVEVAGYQFKLLGIQSVSGPNYDAARGEFELSKNGKVLRTLEPEKRNYRSSAMPMTETAIDSGITRDVYVSMGESLDEGRAWAVRVYYKPFVTWIWVGCLFMALGGALAAADRRYRFKIRQSAAVQGAAA